MRKLNREIAVLGATSVGKSALTKRFVDNEFPTEYDPTIFKRHAMQTTMNGVDYQLTLYDTAGLEQHAQIPHNYLKSNGFALVYSIIDAQSFKIVQDIYKSIAEELIQESIPIVLIGNKLDLGDRRNVTLKQGQDYAKSINAMFFETSARTGSSVRESFHGLLTIIDDHTPGGHRINNETNNNRINANNNNNNNSQTSTSVGGVQTPGQQQQPGVKRVSVATNNRPADGEKSSNSKCIIS